MKPESEETKEAHEFADAITDFLEADKALDLAFDPEDECDEDWREREQREKAVLNLYSVAKRLFNQNP